MSPLRARERAPKAERDTGSQVATPVVDLLPDVVRNRRALRAVRLRCVVLLLAVVLALVAALAWGMSARSSAQSRETAVQAESDALAAQINGYADLVSLRSDITAVRSAIADGMRNEVLWADLVRHVQDRMPSWALLESGSISITFESDYLDQADDDPFDPGFAIGTITWVVHVPTLQQSGELLTVFDAMDGLFGATFTSVERDEQLGTHKVSGTVQIDASRRSQRYVESPGEAGAEAGRPEQEEEAA
ncbi:hypothetical protein [Cellulomonas pakistanensis]|uniref:Uncharacterized protein n=1 Tax=Cellulomonas pakistanensis TaxID=992287 RepID=A0A919U3Y6_9CELL|nr:hypothetical protein [Cellulomonas pakistanensis]GIG36866.1 hypothetical protein Cpa01nite_22470 [Cellulomonas pakistanensis]